MLSQKEDDDGVMHCDFTCWPPVSEKRGGRPVEAEGNTSGCVVEDVVW